MQNRTNSNKLCKVSLLQVMMTTKQEMTEVQVEEVVEENEKLNEDETTMKTLIWTPIMEQFLENEHTVDSHLEKVPSSSHIDLVLSIRELTMEMTAVDEVVRIIDFEAENSVDKTVTSLVLREGEVIRIQK